MIIQVTHIPSTVLIISLSQYIFHNDCFSIYISLYLYNTMYSILSKFAAIRSLTAMAVCVVLPINIPLIYLSIYLLLLSLSLSLQAYILR